METDDSKSSLADTHGHKLHIIESTPCLPCCLLSQSDTVLCLKQLPTAIQTEEKTVFLYQSSSDCWSAAP